MGGRAAGAALVLALLWSPPGQAATYLVRPDGLGDFPTIQAALDAVQDGDTIELADGTFTGDGNRDLDFLGKSLTVRSQSGDPQFCIIDCEGSETEPHRGFCFTTQEGPDARIESITITNGWGPTVPTNWSAGGAVYCGQAWPTLTDCLILDNHATQGGGVFAWEDGGPTIIECTFIGNTADYGGGMRAGETSAPLIEGCVFAENSTAYEAGGFGCTHEATPILTDCLFTGNSGNYRGGAVCNNGLTVALYDGCTFAGNDALQGGAVSCCVNSINVLRRCTFEGNRAPNGGSSVDCGCHAVATLERCILAFGLEGGSASIWSDGEIHISCSDIFGNAGGDWVECIAEQYGINGNFSADPLFCEAATGDLSLHQDSPCMPGQHPLGDECQIIGAWPIGCPISPVIDGPVRSGTYGLTRCAPNPFRSVTWITYVLPGPLPAGHAEDVQLCIHDASGRLVRTLATAPPTAGQHTLPWDGMDDAGRRLPAGTYYCRMRWGGQTTLRHLSLVH
jgi:hypothetical protein